MTTVEVLDLKHEYKLGQTVVPVLKGISFKLKKGDFVCLYGPSGSGKSTILNLIGGLDKPSSGKIFVEQEEVTSFNEQQLALYRQQKIGFIFQSFNLIPTLSALKNVELPLIFAGVSETKRREMAEQLLQAVGLSDRLAHKPTELSGGEQQRVAIARALVNDPTLILADEPTGNLDTKTSLEILNLLKKTNQKTKQTFIVVTHDPEVAAFADKILRLRDGILVSEEIKGEKV